MRKCKKSKIDVFQKDIHRVLEVVYGMGWPSKIRSGVGTVVFEISYPKVIFY